MPARTETVMLSGSYSTIPHRPVVRSARRAERGGFPSSSWVAPPTGIMLRPASQARFIASDSSSADDGVSSRSTATPSTSISFTLATSTSEETTVPGREHLARVAEVLRVEDPPEPLHRREVLFGEEQVHVLVLLAADPVLAAERPAGGDADAQHLLGGLEDMLLLAGLLTVEQEDRVEVPVAGVKDAGDADSLAVGDLVD